MRTNLFLKVVVEHDDQDPPEKLAAELCRLLERNFMVRRAELSGVSRQEE